jgi:hypothetical protein
MKRAARHTALVLPLLLLASCCPPPRGHGAWSRDDDFFAVLRDEQSGGNGIDVGEPKIYDDASLRLLLDQARQRLAAINGFNESALLAHLGALSGSRIDQTQFGVQVTGSPLPGISTVANGATTQTTTNSNVPSASTAPGSTVVTTAPTQNVTTTAPSVAPPASPVVPAGLAFTPPTALSGSALDVLNEEMQLTSEIQGLQLLLEGALSDRFVKNQHIVKPRATIGFPISLTPQRRYQNAVAVVEVEIKTANPSLADDLQPEPPAITTLLPREKTYNVAAITDRMTSIGAGAVIGTVGLAGSFLSGHKTFYVVQDQDTVAILRPPDPRNTEKNAASFAWEFHPVLGQEFVRGGMKQTFVQVALPLLSSVDCFGAIKVRTYWRRFDQRTGLILDVIKGSVLTHASFAIPRYDLTPFVTIPAYQDLGDGTVLVSVPGNFLTGTYVQLGPARYDVTAGLRVEDDRLSFVAPAAALARWTARVVSRAGTSTGLLNPAAQRRLAKLRQFSCADEKEPPPAECPLRCTRIKSDAAECPLGCTRIKPASPDCLFGSIKIKQVAVRPLDESSSEVRVDFEPVPPPAVFPDGILLDVGHRVFGLGDTQVTRDPSPAAPRITAVVPTALLVAAGQVRAFKIFWTAPDGDEASLSQSACFNSVWQLPDFALDSAVERLVLVAVDKDGNASYLLYGNGLAKATVLPPGKASLSPVDNLPRDRVLLVQVKKEDLPTTKKLILQKTDGNRPLVLDLPLPDAKPQPPPKISLDSPVVQNTDVMEIPVERAGDLTSVKMGDKQLQAEPAGKDSIRLKNLRADGVTSEQKTRELTFAFKDGTKLTLKLEVVAARVAVK